MGAIARSDNRAKTAQTKGTIMSNYKTATGKAITIITKENRESIKGLQSENRIFNAIKKLATKSSVVFNTNNGKREWFALRDELTEIAETSSYNPKVLTAKSKALDSATSEIVNGKRRAMKAGKTSKETLAKLEETVSALFEAGIVRESARAKFDDLLAEFRTAKTARSASKKTVSNEVKDLIAAVMSGNATEEQKEQLAAVIA